MSAVEDLKIVLQHDIDEQYQYQPGEIVRGLIVIRLARLTAIRTINIKVYGEGNVSWKEEGGEVLQAREIYVDAIKAVVDTTNFEPLSLPQGNHEFPFDYVLPDSIPSSFIGKFGNVTYTLRATVTGVKSNDTSISSEPFLVLRHSPLPDHALESLSLKKDQRQWATCGCGLTSIKVSLQEQGGVPGQDIYLNAELQNRSRRVVTAMQAALVMKSIYRAKNHSTEFSQMVSKKRDEFDVTNMEGRRWVNVRLSVPPYIPESKLEHCDIIELEYVFQFRVEFTGGSQLAVEAPLWIGSQPQGLELPANEKAGLKINRQWTVRGSRLLEDDQNGHASSGLEYDEGWGVNMVPELRPESSVVQNPLFQSRRFKRPARPIPEELIENTKL